MSLQVVDKAAVSEETLGVAEYEPQDERFYYASQRELMWWRFRQHKLALLSAGALVALYLMAIFGDFLIPYGPWQRFDSVAAAPPTHIHFSRPGEGLQWPFVYRVERRLDPVSYKRTHIEIKDKKYPIGFFVQGAEYRLLGVIPTTIHLFGVDQEAGLYLFGLDLLGRDIFSRTLYGARVSLFIGLVGVSLTFFFGILLGGVAGYLGGLPDMILERINEVLRTVPTLPLLVVLSGAIPKNWPIVQTYFVLTMILSLVGWVGLARVVRGKLLSMREEDFALAAKVAGCSPLRVIFRHLLPAFSSQLIVTITLAIPAMILNETALSFLGLGLYPPAVSWGVLLMDARDINAIASMPWMLIPAIWVLATVLLFNFVGDGLRDAADPFKM